MQYVLGFIFTYDLDQVLLIDKKTSDHPSANGWNGVGGAVKDGEFLRKAFLRESLEEIGLDLIGSEEVLSYSGTMEVGDSNIVVYSLASPFINSNSCLDTAKEECKLFYVDSIDYLKNKAEHLDYLVKTTYEQQRKLKEPKFHPFHIKVTK